MGSKGKIRAAIISALFGRIFFGGFIGADEISGISVLTWESALAVARAKNPETRSARFAVDSALSGYKASYGNFLPQVTGAGSLGNSDTTDDGFSASSDHSISLTARQSLFSGFSSKASLESAKARLQSAEAGLKLAESRARNNLRAAFVSVLYAQENEALLARIRARRSDNKDMIQLRYNAGRENMGSLLRAQALLSRAFFELAKAGRESINTRRRLARHLGLKGEIPPVSGDFVVSVDSSSTPDFQNLLRATPAYQISISQLELARWNIVSAKSDFFPSVDVSGTGRRSGSDSGSDRNSWSVLGSVSYPLFSGMSGAHNLKAARTDLERVSADHESVVRETEVALEEAHAALLDAVGFFKVQEEFLAASEERAKIARAQYSNGLISFQDWDQIESDLINAQKDALTARRGMVLASSVWDQTAGKGLETP